MSSILPARALPAVIPFIAAKIITTTGYNVAMSGFVTTLGAAFGLISYLAFKQQNGATVYVDVMDDPGRTHKPPIPDVETEVPATHQPIYQYRAQWGPTIYENGNTAEEACSKLATRLNTSVCNPNCSLKNGQNECGSIFDMSPVMSTTQNGTVVTCPAGYQVDNFHNTCYLTESPSAVKKDNAATYKPTSSGIQPVDSSDADIVDGTINPPVHDGLLRKH
jgi:hypothetical protein